MFSNLTDQKKGIYFAFITAFISGISIFLNKFALDVVKPPLYFTSIKNFSVGILIACIILFSRELGSIKKLKKKELAYLFLIGVVGGSIPFYLYFTGLSQIPAINGAMIHKTLVVWVAVFAIPFLKEKLSKTQISGVLLLFISNFMIGGFKGFEFSRGEMFVLAATILWAIENVLAKKILATVKVNIVVLFRMGLGSLILAAATFATLPNVVAKTFSLDISQVFWITLTGAFLLGYVLTWYKALKYSSAITVTSILVSSTLITNFLSAIFITHTWETVITSQSLLIAGAVILLLGTERKESHQMASN